MSSILKKTVLITGCTQGGIGHALAKNFHSRGGHHVFATVRDPSSAPDLAALPDLDLLTLDVTVPSSIRACIDTVAERTDGRLDILINNAGVEFVSPLLDLDLAAARALYDVNVWGPLAMVQACAPLLIAAGGTVANMGSIDGVLSMVWAGAFASSKAAAARLSETLRCELAPLGVRVVTVIAGSVDTPMFVKPGGKMRLPEGSHYRAAARAADEEREEHRGQATRVDVFAERMVKEIVGGGGTGGPVWFGSFAAVVRYATWAFPPWCVDWMINAKRGVGLVRLRYSHSLSSRS